MSSRKIERFQRQQKFKKTLSVNTGCEVDPASILAVSSMDTGVTASALEAFEERLAVDHGLAHSTVSVDIDEANNLIEEIRQAWSKERLDVILNDCRKQVISSVITPFGLGSIVAAYDKIGGNVTTLHNAHNDIYAKEEHEYNREEYTGSGTGYQKSRKDYIDSKISQDFTVKDEYSGADIYYRDVDVDHIVSAHEYHQDGGFIQSNKQKQEFASDQDNFAVTAKGANRSKSDKNLTDWENSANAKDPSQTNKEFYEQDRRRTGAAQKRGEATAAKHAPTTTDWAKYYTKELAISGTKEAGKMGLQQAVGLLLTELVEATFFEIHDAYKNGFVQGTEESTFFAALAERLKSMAKKIAAKWQDVVAAFRDGAISGFLSNIVTVFLNTFMTTGKNIVRIIREGLLSLLKAFKLLLLCPDGMTLAEAADAALKVLATGALATIGILANEALEKVLTGAIPIITPFAGIISSVLSGALVGLGSALAVYALDKLDIFGVQKKAVHEHVIKVLDQHITDSDARIQLTYDEAMAPLW